MMNGKGSRNYIEAIRSSSSRYPDLIKFNQFLSRSHLCTGTATVLEFGVGGVQRRNFQNAENLSTYFLSTASGPCKSRLYIMEDLACPFVEAFGAHFWMDPFLFAAQENSTHWTSSKHDHALPQRLQSWKQKAQSFSLRYYEVLRSDEDLGKGQTTTVSNVQRKIEPGDLNDSLSEQIPAQSNYLVRRNASFWWRVRKDGGWDALILTDPPVGDTIVVNNRRQRNWQRKWRSHPYGHGYVDFTPWDSEPVPFIRQDTAHGPPRSSALEDIAWYWTSVADAGQRASVLTDPIIGAIFLKRIVTSNWNVVLEFVWAKLSEFEREIGLLGVGSLGGLADILAEVHLFRRRISWYYEEVEQSIQSVGIPVDEPIDDDGKDLLSILSRLQRCKEKIDSLTSIVTGMLSVHQADISMREAKLVTKLTVIALVFLPLSFTASVFSMGGDYLPGDHLFWVYFAVAVPMTLIVIAVAWLSPGKSTVVAVYESLRSLLGGREL